MTAAPTMTEAAAMAKAATVSITTAVKSEADPNRTIEGRPIAGIAIIGIVIAPAPPIARIICQILGGHRDHASLHSLRGWAAGSPGTGRGWRRVRR